MRRVILLLLIAMFCGGTAFAFEQSVTAGSDAQKVDNLTNFVLRPKYEIKTDAPVAKTEPITSEVKSEETKEVKAKEEEKKEPVSESTEIVKPVTLTPVHDVEKSVTQQVKEENVAEEQSAVEEKPVTEEDFKSICKSIHTLCYFEHNGRNDVLCTTPLQRLLELSNVTQTQKELIKAKEKKQKEDKSWHR